MQATVENEVKDQCSEESIAYTPPDARIGDEIYYYADGVHRPDAPFGKILSVESRNVTLVIYDEYSPHGMKKEHVLHVSDPWLAERPDRRANGAWDFSPSHKRLQLIHDRLERYGDRIVELEVFAASLDPKFSPSNGDAKPRKR